MSHIKFVSVDDVDKSILPEPQHECVFIHSNDSVEYVILSNKKYLNYLSMEQKYFTILAQHALVIPENKLILKKMTDVSLPIEERMELGRQLQLDSSTVDIIRDTPTW